MESNVGITPPLGNRSKSTLLTPCRRLGLARKSPASSGSWNAPKPSTSFSPSKRKLECEAEITDDNVKNQHTPKRSYYRQPLKMLKTFNSPSGSGDVSGCNSRLQPKFKAPAIVRRVSPERGSEDSLSQPVDLNSVSGVTESMLEQLKMRVKKKEEQLKDAKQTQIYKKKHDVKTLQTLIDKWREGCQHALRELLALIKMRGHPVGMEQILGNLRIPHNLVSYSAELDDFE